jgi:hypothetical protein
MTFATTDAATTVRIFTRLKLRRLFTSAGLISAMFLSFLCSDREAGVVFGVIPEVEWVLLLVACSSALLVFMITMWRCPVCRHHLGGDLNPDHCTNCGARLGA